MTLRLSARLVLSHTLLAGVLVAALVLTSTALVRMTNAVGEIRDAHLASLDADQDVHRAAWGVEVALRHALASCTADEAGPEPRAKVAAATEALRAQIAAAPADASPGIVGLARRYLGLAERTLGGDTCRGVSDEAGQRERIQLDEWLTDAWVARLVELHGVMERREDEIRRTGRAAVVAGTSVGLCATLVGLATAIWIARGVTRPLERLGAAARRLGEGDFREIPREDGAREVTALSLELDRTRARLAEVDQLKEGFVASVSHELRTPLGRLREALALLGDGTLGPLAPPQARVTALARDACEREIRLVTALLDLSRLRSGRPLRIEAGTSLDDVVGRAVEEEGVAADAAGVRIVWTSHDDGPRLALDGPLVERAVANLVRNAVSVSAAGGEVRVVRRRAARGAGATGIEISVRDEGPGVPSRAVAELFTAFAPHPVASRPEGGVGLGLAFVREVMRAHGGDVALTANGPNGAEFALFFPAEDL